MLRANQAPLGFIQLLRQQIDQTFHVRHLIFVLSEISNGTHLSNGGTWKPLETDLHGILNIEELRRHDYYNSQSTIHELLNFQQFLHIFFP